MVVKSKKMKLPKQNRQLQHLTYLNMNGNKVKHFFLMMASVLFMTTLWSCGDRAEKESTLNPYSSLRDISKLQLAQMSIGKVGVISDPGFEEASNLSEKAKALFDKMKIGKRIGVYSYDTYLSAYVDLSELREEDVVLDPAAKSITLTLPPVRIEYEGQDMTLKEEHYRVTGLRSSISPSERSQLKGQMASELKKEVKADPQIDKMLTETARRKAVQYFTLLLNDLGYENVNVNF